MFRATSQLSFGSQVEADYRQFFTCVGTLKGTIVAVKMVNKKSVEITRNIQKELKVVSSNNNDKIDALKILIRKIWRYIKSLKRIPSVK